MSSSPSQPAELSQRGTPNVGVVDDKVIHSPATPAAEAALANACQMETIKPGDSTHYPEAGDTVRVHYEGFTEDGTKFDSSRERGRPIDFKVGDGQVIPGWEECIPKMSRGQIAKLVIPPVHAYGATGYPPV
jgi:FK506-binding protein 1